MSKYVGKRFSGFLVVFYILLFMALAAGVVFVYQNTNGFNESLKDFYVEIDGVKIQQSEIDYTFDVEKENRIECKYLSSEISDDVKGYSVKVVPHITNQTNFSYFKDGVAYNYKSIKDVTAGFNIQKEETSFVLTFSREDNPLSVLKKVLNDDSITSDEEFNYDLTYYTLVISSANGKGTYNINFNISGLFAVDFDSGFIAPDDDTNNVVVNSALGIFGYGTFKCSLEDSLPNDDYSTWKVLPDEFVQSYNSGVLLSFYGEEVSYICSGAYDSDPCYIVCDFGESGKSLGDCTKFNVVLKCGDTFYDKGEFGSGVSFRFTDNTVATFNTADDYFSYINLSAYAGKKIRAVEWWVSRSDIRFFGLTKGS